MAKKSEVELTELAARIKALIASTGGTLLTTPHHQETIMTG